MACEDDIFSDTSLRYLSLKLTEISLMSSVFAANDESSHVSVALGFEPLQRCDQVVMGFQS